MLHDIAYGKSADSSPETPAASEQLARQQAIRRIERKRHFRIRATIGALGMIILVIIWAFSEYHNAGGWPMQGFSQSSGLHDVWNFWIIYPAIAWVLVTAGDAWWTFGRKPISESEIQREVDRQPGLQH